LSVTWSAPVFTGLERRWEPRAGGVRGAQGAGDFGNGQTLGGKAGGEPGVANRHPLRHLVGAVAQGLRGLLTEGLHKG
jgi:hypothetical protein